MSYSLRKEDLIKTALTPNSSVDAVIITTNLMTKANGDAVMGKGIALAAAQNFSGLQKEYGKFLSTRSKGSNLLFTWIQPNGILGPAPKTVLIMFPTKVDWRNPSIPALIEAGLKELVAL